MKKGKILLFAVFISCAVFAGCAGSPLAISLMPAKDLWKVYDNQLSAAYAWGRSDKIKTELKKRHLFDEREWVAIDDKDIFVGMSKNAMLAARANLFLTGISKIGQYGPVEIYKEGATTVDAYIYVRDNKVIGYQMW